MIILYTKKLQNFLGLPGKGILLPENINFDACWQGNIFLVKRKKILQLTHEKTRYTIFIDGITKKDLKNLNKLILNHLKYHIFQDKLQLKEMKYIISMSNEACSYFKKPNRVVQGTMNNMRAIYENSCFSEGKIDDKAYTHQINSMLFTIDGKYKLPAEAFKEFVSDAVKNASRI